MFEFNATNKGEANAKKYLESNGWKVIDQTNNSDYWSKDIDFTIVKNNPHTRFNVEVKWDNRISDTGNMFIEYITDLENSKEGWFEFCQADYIFYGDSRNNLFYVFQMDDLRKYLSASIVDKRIALDTNTKGIVKKVSQGFLVPIDDFSTHYHVQVIQL